MECRTVLINAGPWLPVPPDGYGGIENVVATLVPQLRRRGVRVVLATVGSSRLAVDRLVSVFDEPMFAHLTGPYNQMMGIAHAHMGCVLRALGEEPIDLVHDHLEVVGPAVLAALGRAGPPVLQTLHWDLHKHPDFYASFDGRGCVSFCGVSESQLARAPARLRAQALGAVPLGVGVHEIPFRAEKGAAFLALARLTEIKGTDIAARVCRERGWRLDLAGPVAGARGPKELDPEAALPDARFYRERVRVLEDGRDVRWIGTVTGAEKHELLGRAKALLCPVRWDEPGGTAVCEALACGTPVIAMRRGVMPQLIEHGVTGFLADDEAEFAACAARAGEIDPAACRRAAEERFTAAAMADRYLELYGEVTARARPGWRAGAAPPAPSGAREPVRTGPRP